MSKSKTVVFEMKEEELEEFKKELEDQICDFCQSMKKSKACKVFKTPLACRACNLNIERFIV